MGASVFANPTRGSLLKACTHSRKGIGKGIERPLFQHINQPTSA